MGFFFRKRFKLGKNSSVNVSKRGVSLSRRFGPVSVSTRKRGSVRLGKGFFFRF